VLDALRSWLDSWRGMALWSAAIAHPGSYDLQLTGYDARGWRATFYPIVSNPTMKSQ